MLDSLGTAQMGPLSPAITFQKVVLHLSEAIPSSLLGLHKHMHPAYK